MAAYFEKDHKHVLRDIDVLLAHGPNLGHVKDQELRSLFHETTVAHPTVQGRKDWAFVMTRDGFTLLTMGFEGPAAGQLRERWLPRREISQRRGMRQHPDTPPTDDRWMPRKSWGWSVGNSRAKGVVDQP